MKSIVVYYSLSGNTKIIAETIAGKTGSDLLRLEPVNDLNPKSFGKYLWGGRQVCRKAKPELKPYSFDNDKYDILLFGSPVWAWTFAPAIRSFLEKEKITGKRATLFCCHGGGKGKVFERFASAMEGNIVLPSIDFREPLKTGVEAAKQKALEWAEKILKME